MGGLLQKNMVAKNEPQSVKGCRVKTQGLVRLKKEYLSYINEKTGLENKVKEIKAGEDPHEIKKWTEILEENEAVIVHVKGKLDQGVEDLEMYLEEYEEDEELVAAEEILQTAKATLEDTRTWLESLDNNEKSME